MTRSNDGGATPPQCPATTVQGEGCRGTPYGGSAYCYAHDPACAGEREAAAEERRQRKAERQRRPVTLLSAL